ncbi:hypothetical protein LEP1GSC005_1356 [Leptospira santarosai str. ST188]|uniref:hypothetical protein n=1 Tax=Leptospira santarosai TaxID=28183 RepID=UPI0002BBEDEC|nr:hypothetical protein [Leptospira santarosai]EMF91179.1 hypothetical protein LEP1GSC005_1356 [Leptospira santarosai str. ST188]
MSYTPFQKIRDFKRYFERTRTHKIITYYTAVWIYRLRLSFVFPKYIFGMLKLAFTTWKHKVKFRTEVPGQMMILHYNSETIEDPAIFVKQIEESVIKPFRILHKVNPVVLILPFGTTFQAGNFKGFVRSLDRDQKQALTNAIYEMRQEKTNLEIVPSNRVV